MYTSGHLEGYLLDASNTLPFKHNKTTSGHKQRSLVRWGVGNAVSTWLRTCFVNTCWGRLKAFFCVAYCKCSGCWILYFWLVRTLHFYTSHSQTITASRSALTLDSPNIHLTLSLLRNTAPPSGNPAPDVQSFPLVSKSIWTQTLRAFPHSKSCRKILILAPKEHLFYLVLRDMSLKPGGSIQGKDMASRGLHKLVGQSDSESGPSANLSGKLIRVSLAMGSLPHSSPLLFDITAFPTRSYALWWIPPIFLQDAVLCKEALQAPTLGMLETLVRISLGTTPPHR